MTLKERIGKDFTGALKAHEDLKVSTLRLLRSEIKKREVSGQKKELSDVEVSEALSTLVKQRRESIRLFQQGGRQDLAQKEEAELQILLGYLPKALSQTELEGLIDEVISETGAAGPKDFGKVMKTVMAQAAGRADGKAVSEAVKQRLSKAAG